MVVVGIAVMLLVSFGCVGDCSWYFGLDGSLCAQFVAVECGLVAWCVDGLDMCRRCGMGRCWMLGFLFAFFVGLNMVRMRGWRKSFAWGKDANPSLHFSVVSLV
ncbi:hypothetical protein BJ741DRAFT_629356 [Chytriomyces cf. hyalinus JEL632]|nr:hypothetical protein BJ741DRAFT_629356 [Chytriomyces cf. hyalinus JEL632]